MQLRSAWHRYWVLFLLLFSLGLALVSISFVLTLKNREGQADVSGTIALTPEPVPADVLVSVPVVSPEPAEALVTASPEPDRAEPDDRLQRLRRDFGYRLDGATLINTDDTPLSVGQIEAEHPLVLQALRQWFYDEPEAFIALAASEERDSYIQTVLRTQINASNVHLLTDQMHIRNRHLIELAYTHQLHLQDPAPFLEIFDQFAGSHLIRVPISVVAAAAEIDYWGRRAVLLEQAVHNPEPGMYFTVVQQQGQENMFELAEQMWSAHLEDNYTEELSPGTGYLERTRLAFQYGVAGAPTELARLQARGLFVDETIETFTEVEDAVARFQNIHRQLEYDYAQQRWRMPALPSQ